MNISKELEKIGIIPLEQLNIEEKNYVSKNINFSAWSIDF